jgi:hypothetical protein
MGQSPKMPVVLMARLLLGQSVRKRLQARPETGEAGSFAAGGIGFWGRVFVVK